MKEIDLEDESRELDSVGKYKQRRSQKRYECDNKISVFDVESKRQFLGRVVNINFSGMALSIKAEKDVKIGKVLIDVFDGEELRGFTVKGEVRYTRGVSPFVIIGVKFEAPSKMTLRKIEDYLVNAREYI